MNMFQPLLNKGEVFYFVIDKWELTLLLTKMINYQSCSIL
jgi:hypothetical protein